MNEPRDQELSRLYRETVTLEPPQRIDDAVLAASRRTAGSRPRPVRAGLVRRLSAPMALAATVLLTFTVTLIVFQDAPEADKAQTGMRAGGADSRAEKPVPAEANSARAPQAESRRDAPSTQPREATDALGKRQGLQESQESQEPRRARESEPTRAARAMQAAPYPRAGSRQEAPSELQGAGVVGAFAGRSAADESKERSPEKWLEDIRKLKTQGKTPEAERELAEFKKRYPEYRLPEDLR